MTRRLPQTVLSVFVALVIIAGAAFGYYRWRLGSATTSVESTTPAKALVDGSVPARVSRQARANLGLVVEPVKPTTYWRKIELPGALIDRPGVSDRGVIAPVTGIVSEIHLHPGETVEPNAPLFSLRITSESLHTSQRELFKAASEIEIARQHRQRLADLAQTGGIAQSRIIEIDDQIQRANVNVEAYRQELLARGLSKEQINAATKGEFVTAITVRAPGEKALQAAEVPTASNDPSAKDGQLPFKFELQELKVSLGQQVEAGQVLCHIADHRTLLVEGRGFKEDMPLIQQAAKQGHFIELVFEERKGINWPPPPNQLRIHHLENSIDTETRTFGFYLVLENQWQIAKLEDHTAILWRFRPGDRVQLQVAVEKMENVFVLPQSAVVREGPEAYVFRQNGDLFDRLPVHVLGEDRIHAVIANDGSVRPGSYLAQNAAASLNRVMKAQLASGQPTNVHVHADGTVHAAH